MGGVLGISKQSRGAEVLKRGLEEEVLTKARVYAAAGNLLAKRRRVAKLKPPSPHIHE